VACLEDRYSSNESDEQVWKVFIASFERIWVDIKHTGYGICSLHGSTVKPSCKHF